MFTYHVLNQIFYCNIPLVILEIYQSKVCQRKKFIEFATMRNALWGVIS